MTDQDVLDITPDPKVLLALTQTPLRPLDALCELIDNAIDAFAWARNAGEPLAHQIVDVTIVGQAAARRGEGSIRVYDNGAGLDRNGLANTLRAGYSGKNRFDTLGLFGMGFNIATGKLGRRTVVTTARAEDDQALRVTLDLMEIVSSRSFNVPIDVVPKPANFSHGTIVEVDQWWPTGDANAGFALQLAAAPRANLRVQLGRRYGSVLRRTTNSPIRILLNQEALTPYEHCVWGSERFVERKNWGNIPARIDFDEVVHSQKRCLQDGSVIPTDSASCLECGAREFRLVAERVHGWVGIQRFDDNNKFGVDLVRNGRTIRVAEKDAFFTYQDSLGETVKEYPTDQQTGRIVGEVHLDHVPVDFQKQDFQRTTEEWARAIAFLRGESLLPSNWGEGERNDSPISTLFQGYRKVRTPGRADMYMGRWDEASGKAVRISRQIEEEFYQRFLAHEDGYYDDSKWWELVEAASTPPVTDLPECPHCGYQNLPGAEVCDGCAAILRAKACVNCSTSLPVSALVCETCGFSQVPEVREPWRCLVCDAINDTDAESCSNCGSLLGTEDPTSVEALLRESSPVESFSFESRTFLMADSKHSEPLSVVGFRAGDLRPQWDGPSVPMITFRSAGRLQVFVHDAHPVFTHLGVKPQELIATEAAHYLWNLRSDLVGNNAHSVPVIASTILNSVWSNDIAASPETLVESIRILFDRVADKLILIDDIGDFYTELDEYEQRDLADRLISAGRLGDLTELVRSGGFIRFVGPSVLTRHFRHRSDDWFGTVWNETLPSEALVGRAVAATAREQRVGIYLRCLEDCAAFARFSFEDPLVVARAAASLEFLEAHAL